MAGKRHRWGQETRGEDPNVCARCGVKRHLVPGDDSFVPMFNYEWPDGRKEAIPVNGKASGVPPCPGRPEEKKP